MVTDVQSSSIPTLGFTGYTVPGEGEYVLFVEPGSLAESMGLGSGDMLLSVNDRPLTATGAWSRAMTRVASGQTRFTLRFRRAQTGLVSSRTMNSHSAIVFP